jgi:Brp/Blh family beta-carotene 15,15'-monooxygenase
MIGHTRSVLLLVLALFYIGLDALGVTWADTFLGTLQFLGLLVIGIPHGALDVWTHRHRSPGRSSLLYIVAYLIAIAAILAAWWNFPRAGMLAFLLLSAWHFGQADFERWEIPQGELAWGTVALGMILTWHVEEVNPIIGQMGISSDVQTWLIQAQEALRFIFTAGLISCGIIALRMKHLSWGLAIALIGLTPWIPVLLSFGLYFIGQHSASGWHHLRHRLGLSSQSLWMRALPFTAGALALIGIGMWMLGNPEVLQSDATIGAFFMLLGCISIPHIFESHWFLMSTTKRQTRH